MLNNDLRYCGYRILTLEHQETKQKIYQLGHWYTCGSSPINGLREIGNFETEKELLEFQEKWEKTNKDYNHRCVNCNGQWQDYYGDGYPCDQCRYGHQYPNEYTTG